MTNEKKSFCALCCGCKQRCVQIVISVGIVNLCLNCLDSVFGAAMKISQKGLREFKQREGI